VPGPVVLSGFGSLGSVQARASAVRGIAGQYRRLSSKLTAAFNSEYREENFVTSSGEVPDGIQLATLQGKSGVSPQRAVSLVNHGCAGGKATILEVGVVEAAFAPAVFYGPPRRHVLPEACTNGPRPDNANWYLGFVGTRRASWPFCTSGHFAGLPSLRTHGTSDPDQRR
jgi:hypothetical protein